MASKIKQLQKEKKISIAIGATFAGILAIVVALSCTFLALFYQPVKTLLTGGDVYYASDIEAAEKQGIEEGYNSGFNDAAQIDFVRKGDLIKGFYFNTEIMPTFEELDWSEALKFTSDNDGTTEIMDMEILWLVTGFEPPKTIEEFQNFRGNALAIAVTHYMKSDGSEAYVLGLDPSTPIYVYLPNGEFYLHKDFAILESGWGYDEDWDGYQALSYAPEGITAVYIDSSQANYWYKFIGKNPFKEPEYGATEHQNGDIITNLYVNTALSDEELYEICQNGLVTKFTGDENLVIELVADVMRPEGEEPVAAICFSFNNDPPVVVWCSRDYSADGRTAVSGWNEVGVDGLIFSAPPVSLGVETEYEYLFNQLFSSTPFCAYKN